jgi:hypothetical protein
MANVTNFKGVLVYTNSSTTYSNSDIASITSGATSVLDYVILNSEQTISDSSAIISQALDVAKKIYNNKSTARIWLGTPIYSAGNTLTYSQIKTYLTDLKSKFMADTTGKLVWQNCVKGIYMNMERIYGTVDYTSTSTMLNNASIKVANDVSYFVHNTLQSTGTTVSTSLDFLWIPYYGYNSDAATIIKNLGHVLSRTNIFDIAIIQPTYYFYYTGTAGNYTAKIETDAQLKTNLNGVKDSIINNSVYYRNDVEVYARTSNATATIGFEMEIDDGYDPGIESGRKAKSTRYNEYVDTFKNYRSKPMCYYAGGRSTLLSKIKKINNFYSGATSSTDLYY